MACLLPICFCELDYTLSQKISRLNELNYKLTRHHTSENSPERSPAQSELEL